MLMELKMELHHRLSGYLLQWMMLCCLVTVVRSDRVMWVDTKGEDGPQCIHHTPSRCTDGTATS